jgi:DNA-binding transcriptional LysR family regulator
MESAVLMILSGHYIGFLPVHFAQANLHAGRLKPVGDPGFGFFDDFQVALHRSRQNAAGKHLADLVRNISVN